MTIVSFLKDVSIPSYIGIICCVISVISVGFVVCDVYYKSVGNFYDGVCPDGVYSAIFPDAIVSVTNSTLYTGAPTAVTTLATTVVGIVAVVAVILILLRRR